ncbi:aliphatic sulfonate ABC transporter periplasmic ligand-binding protein [Caballeronia arationis]|jgi:ABC-type nitrate/sulfonate/bicarbonate transport system substrate-binding protein|uniref:ABC-type nitrate/sulfonate/bicarbonate transport system, substrate-binding protein n=1 Tax=Caballeronia arationis TaxID=1777142 RepID=A0A7Z7I3L2_9BURK|nr:ABC transporter substrate-binding protein [Caballeronia arationis]SAK90649.1 aliphatic sulfonate ABC transporter periplasmic ligand-binding protein [Caballeronia arationis]SOE55855.1 ABC-type nitrate/sulfonate/bicarbonate transport system, substrate-binding protein [Caballeronia arationis]
MNASSSHHRPRVAGPKVLAACAAVALALLGGCKPSQESGQASTAANAQSGRLEITYFKYPDNPAFDLVYLADKLGYFDGTSTRPRYVGKVSAPQIIPLVGTGEIDFGTRMVPLVISAIASGADIKVVSAGGVTLPDAPHMKYFTRKDSGIRGPKDFEGKTVAFNSFGACAEFVTKKYLSQNGVDVSKVNWLVVPDNQSQQALATRNVDIAIIHPPFSGAAEADPQLHKLWSDWDEDRGLGGMAPYSVNGAFARAHPQAVKDFVSAIARAGNWVNAHPDEARKLTAERLGIDEKLVERYAYVKDLVVTEPPIQYYIEILEQAGKIPKGKVAVKDVYTNEYNPYATQSTAGTAVPLKGNPS